MSMDLYVWKGPLVSSEDETNELLDRDPDGFEPSDDVGRFYDELLARYPALESFGIGAFLVLMAVYSVVVRRRE